MVRTALLVKDLDPIALSAAIARLLSIPPKRGGSAKRRAKIYRRVFPRIIWRMQRSVYERLFQTMNQ
jgi:hypothetical protein